MTLLPAASETEESMARYSAFLGRRVEVQYRAGDILLPASGTFVADSGRSIFLEQSYELRGSQRYFRWEIPYQYIVRLEEKLEAGQSSSAAASRSATASAESSVVVRAPDATSSGAGAKLEDSSSMEPSAGGAPGILPLRNRPKTA